MAIYNGTEHYVMMGLQGIELVTNTLLTCPCSAINFILILRTSILHPNLKFILLSQSLSIFTRGIGQWINRIARITNIHWLGRWWMSWNALLTGNEVWMSGYQWNQVYLFASQFRQFLAHVLIVERLMATVFVQNYENWRKPYFSLIWLIILVSQPKVSSKRCSLSDHLDTVQYPEPIRHGQPTVDLEHHFRFDRGGMPAFAMALALE